MKSKILLTGASGFVGSSVCRRLLNSNYDVVVAGRQRPSGDGLPVSFVHVTDLDSKEDWAVALEGADAVVHCAARVHVMRESAVDPLKEFRRVNVLGTLHLARQAAAAGVRRFVYISSIKVNGEHSRVGEPFTPDQVPAPADSYGISKYEAELGLRELAIGTGMEVVIIRPPLVYGPGVKANFLAMIRWLWRGIPLPLGGITENRRSLVFIDNLVDLISICIDHPAAANQTFLISDDEDLSTSALLRRMAAALARPVHLIPLPANLMVFAAKLIGRPGVAERLCGSLQVDISKTKELLGWFPPISVDEGLRITAQHWLDAEKRR